MKKRKIDHFFLNSPNKIELQHKQYFLYNPNNFQSVFTRKIESQDIFIATKSGLKLYYRPFSSHSSSSSSSSSSSHLPAAAAVVAQQQQQQQQQHVKIPLLDPSPMTTTNTATDSVSSRGSSGSGFGGGSNNAGTRGSGSGGSGGNPSAIPLLKSNLQKSIRRGQSMEALQSTLALFRLDPTQLLRRLTIIMIEDVDLFDSFPLLLWWMIADKDYQLTEFDLALLLNIAYSLCQYQDVVDVDFMGMERKEEDSLRYDADSLEDHQPYCDMLLALYYRSLYGGMPCDITMLHNAIAYLLHSEKRGEERTVIVIDEGEDDEVVVVVEEGEGEGNRIGDERRTVPSDHLKVKKTGFAMWNFSFIKPFLSILPQAIDFHPFPQLVGMVIKKFPDLSVDEVKGLIWEAESGVNIRKPATVSRALEVQSSPQWLKIVNYLQNIRKWLRDKRE